MDIKTYLEDMKARGKIDQVKFDKAIAKIGIKETAKANYTKNKGKMTDKQRLDAIEKILGI